MEKLLAESLVEAGKNRRKPTMVRASSIGMCKRRVGYDLLGYEGLPESAHGRVTLDIGEALHLTVQRYLINIGWINSKLNLDDNGEIGWTNPEFGGCEIPFQDKELRVTGRCDGVTVPLVRVNDKDTDGFDSLHPSPEGKRYLVEIKSITDRASFFVLGIMDGGTDTIREEEHETRFIDLTPSPSSTSGKLQQLLYNFQHSRKVTGKRGARTCPVYKLKVDGKDQLVTVLLASNMLGKFSNLKKPLPQHIQQASIYANHFGLENILFVYIAKDANPFLYEDENNLLNIPIKILEYKIKSEEVALIKSGVQEIYRYVDNGELPPREYTPDSTDCKFCPHRKTCYE